MFGSLQELAGFKTDSQRKLLLVIKQSHGVCTTQMEPDLGYLEVFFNRLYGNRFIFPFMLIFYNFGIKRVDMDMTRYFSFQNTLKPSAPS